MRSQIQDALLGALDSILRPIVKLMLLSGISYSEFASVAKRCSSEWPLMTTSGVAGRQTSRKSLL